jgi:prolyl oligopeptidase
VTHPSTKSGPARQVRSRQVPHVRSVVGVGVALTLGLIAGCSRGDRAVAPSSPPPVTRASAVTENLHGVQVVDNYRWLEEDSTEVSVWTEAQSRHTRTVLDQLPGRKALENRLRPLVQIGSVSAPIVRANRYFSARRAANQEKPAIYVRDGALGAERLLIDPSTNVAVTWISPSEDGALLAYGAFRPEDGTTTLRLLEVASGKPLSLEIGNVLDAAQWTPDGTGFIYHELRDAADPSSRQGKFHRLGMPASADVILYRQAARPQGADRGAPASGPSSTLSRDGRWLVLSYWLDPSSNDMWLARFDEYLQRGARASRVVSVGDNGRAEGTVIDDTLYLHTTKGAPRGRVIAVSAAQPEQKLWREIVPQRSEAIESVAFGRGTIAVTYVKDAASVIEVFDVTGRSLGLLAQPTIGAASVTARDDRTEAYLTFASFTYPPTIFRVDLATPGAPPKYWSGSDLPYDVANMEVRHVTFPSKDGTPIGMFLAHRKGLPLNGTAPTLLSGYGAFKVSMVPTFAAPFLQWFDAGGILAVPNLRGGGEYGDSWHEAGMLGKKQNGIDDFIAAAEWLIANKYTSAKRLAAYGLSNGGLIAGAALVERPQLFNAVVLGAPLLDMLRYHKFVREPYWTAEYGTADNAEQFKWLMAYSPYHRVKAGTKYPAVLLTAIAGEGEVNALHARKMTAALQAAASATSSDRPVLLRIDRPPSDSSALFDLELRDLVDQRLFLMWQLGLL